MSDVNDPRVVAGMARLMATRDAMLADGAKSVGWKAGVGAPGAREALKTNEPLAGFLTDKTLVSSGTAIALATLTKAAVECEIAIHIGTDLSADPSDDEIKNAIVAIGPAIELADISPPPTDVETVIASNIFHSCVIIGPKDESFAGGVPTGLTCVATRDGVEDVNTDALEEFTGTLVDVTRIVARLVGTHGPGIKAGEFIIAGSITAPPLFVENPQEISYTLGSIGTLSISFT